jgi:hypothetical protein
VITAELKPIPNAAATLGKNAVEIYTDWPTEVTSKKSAADFRIDENTSNIVINVLILQLFALIYLQKFAVHLGGDLQVSATLIFTFASLAWLAVRGALRFEQTRFLLFCVFISSAVLSQLLAAVNISYSSLFILILLYFTFTLNWIASAEQLRKLGDFFSNFMLLPAVLVFVQFAYELAYGAGNSLSLDKYLPDSILLGGYIYESSTETWVTWNRPNGLIFLEPSFCSAFLACAVIHALDGPPRHMRAAFFSLALLATSGATGIAMLLIAGTTIGLRRSTFVTIIAAAIVIFGVLLLDTSDSTVPFLSRFAELNDSKSSGYGRLLLPIQTLLKLLPDPNFLLWGAGAGQITPEFGSPWPLAKLAYEYGSLTAISYFVFCILSILGTANVPLRVALFIIFQFTGGHLLSPFFVFLVFLTCTSLTPSRSDDIEERGH